MEPIPQDLEHGYSMNGKVKIALDDRWYSEPSSARGTVDYSEELVNSFMDKAKDREALHYPESDNWLYQALDKYSIQAHNTLVIGSEEPYYEALAILNGAAVTMVEYQKITSSHPKLNCLTAEEFPNVCQVFDSAISISSVEHSGLGRYGEALDPDGDIAAMQELHDKLKIGGICFLAVPVGIDRILWNAHRVYGVHRFNALVQKFSIIDSFGFQPSDFDADELDRRNTGILHRPGIAISAHQPVFVLQRQE